MHTKRNWRIVWVIWLVLFLMTSGFLMFQRGTDYRYYDAISIHPGSLAYSYNWYETQLEYDEPGVLDFLGFTMSEHIDTSKYTDIINYNPLLPNFKYFAIRGYDGYNFTLSLIMSCILLAQMLAIFNRDNLQHRDRKWYILVHTLCVVVNFTIIGACNIYNLAYYGLTIFLLIYLYKTKDLTFN